MTRSGIADSAVARQGERDKVTDDLELELVRDNGFLFIVSNMPRRLIWKAAINDESGNVSDGEIEDRLM